MKPQNLEKAVKKYGYVFLQGKLQELLARQVDESVPTLFNQGQLSQRRRAMSKLSGLQSVLWFYFG